MAKNVNSLEIVVNFINQYLRRLKNTRFPTKMLAEPEVSAVPHVCCKSRTPPRLLCRRHTEYFHSSRRGFINFPGSSNLDRRKQFNGRKLVGFSMQQMYDVVSDVEHYKDFVPFCKKSLVHRRTADRLTADLIIGFPPIVESYTSHVTLVAPNVVHAECKDATLFDHLVTSWKFTPGLSNHPLSCVIEFQISFEFKSSLHSHLANLFFNELVKQMEKAFYSEAVRRYGKPSIPSIKLKLLDSRRA
ncbi:coenzyme Q-binding protein COQ10 homolog B, mitochondrial-like [Nilaparvata lugens]|uniref:coenzyme Q-binding protein COQ10 homolog B, mitochondrial-like n=1 Tax=Nilaparvata lugens TaxID=108931 RepID=UPI00193CC449|nr:coenzyme Q-binding protein COQ10 homolog B, mitochondrial-like [Nilaparvata lugens]